MSVARLCAAALGYAGQGAAALDPDSFKWPFQHEEAVPLLDWICTSLRSSDDPLPHGLSCTLIQSFEQLLFASSATAEPPLTTPRPLMQELDEMEKVNSQHCFS